MVVIVAVVERPEMWKLAVAALELVGAKVNQTANVVKCGTTNIQKAWAVEKYVSMLPSRNQVVGMNAAVKRAEMCMASAAAA
jgi:hypothetical protein